MDNLLSAITNQNPLLLLGLGIVIIFIVIGIIKALFRIVIFGVIVGMIAIFAFGVSPETLLDKGMQLKEQSTQIINENVKPIIMEQIQTATFVQGENGSFTLQNEDFELSYSETKEVTIRIKSMDVSFTLDELSNMLTQEELNTITNVIEQQKNAVVE